jgi:pimeloyl-ACP methyl ester carboxylesterase
MTRPARSAVAGGVASSVFTVAPAQSLAAEPSGGTQGRPIDAVRLERVALEGIELEYTVQGAGEPVLLIHAGVFADWFVPLLDEPRLTQGCQLIHYHRVGYAGSSRATGPVSIGEQAAQARALLRHLGIGRAHVVGHSSGGSIALQLARDAPETVATLTLLEPALAAAPSHATFIAEKVVPTVGQFHAGDRAGAVDSFMRAVAGPEYRAVVDQALPPGALAQAEADAATFFGIELPSFRQWTFAAEDAARIDQPVLAVLGADSPAISPVFAERQELLLAWLADAEPFVLPGATHLLHLQNQRAFVDALTDFFGRHPLTTSG